MLQFATIMFWAWLLKYSSFFVTGAVSLLVGYVLHKITTRRAALICYNSHPQWVTLPPPPAAEQPALLPPGAQQQPAPPLPAIGTFTLFLWNQGNAPARDVGIGHFWLPANNVYPDIPREIEKTLGGGTMLRFPVVPPRTLVSVSYLFFGIYSAEQIISFVGSEEGTAKRIQVGLQRIWPGWFNKMALALMVGGFWVVVNLLLSLISFLAHTYWK